MTPDEARTQLFADQLFTVATTEGALAPVNGPGGLPYVALFRDEAEARAGFARSAQALAPVPGKWACEAATQAGWGIAFQPGMEGQLVLSFGQICDLITPPTDDEARQAQQPWQPEGGGSIMIAEPDKTLVSDGMRHALYSVSATTPGLRRAWLILAVGARRRLIVVAEVAAGFDGQAFVQRLGWATPAARPVDLMLAGDSGPLSLDAMSKRTPYFTAEQTA